MSMLIFTIWNENLVKGSKGTGAVLVTKKKFQNHLMLQQLHDVMYSTSLTNYVDFLMGVPAHISRM